MSQRLIIANWKMQLSYADQLGLARALARRKIPTTCDVVLCPTHTALQGVAKLMAKSVLQLGSQNMFWQERGAYTGEESPVVLRELGCNYVIIGHSERREHLGETDAMVARKASVAVDAGLIPIVCVGETASERQEQRTMHAISRQLGVVCQNLDLVGAEQLIIAYEPVWAIGRGQALEVSLAHEVIGMIEQILHDHFPLTIIQNNIRIIYGGSVTAADVASYLKIPRLSGFLVGGASLKVETLSDIIQAAARS